MKTIFPHYSHANTIPLFCDKTYIDALQVIEDAARICYQSEKCRESGIDSTIEFLDRLYRMGHYSVFEHSNFVIKSKDPIPDEKMDSTICSAFWYFNAKFINEYEDINGHLYFGGNLRAWFESMLEYYDEERSFHDITPKELLKFANMACYDLMNKVEFEIVDDLDKVPIDLKRFGVKIIHNRAFTHEIVRHRVMSFSQESQRYCNYASNKYHNEITYISTLYEKPSFLTDAIIWFSCWVAEKAYVALVKRGIPPQIARSVLPNACKTSIYISGDKAGWKHLFDLRCSPKAHPEMRSMMYKIAKYFEDYIHDYTYIDEDI